MPAKKKKSVAHLNKQIYTGPRYHVMRDGKQVYRGSKGFPKHEAERLAGTLVEPATIEEIPE